MGAFCFGSGICPNLSKSSCGCPPLGLSTTHPTACCPSWALHLAPTNGVVGAKPEPLCLPLPQSMGPAGANSEHSFRTHLGLKASSATGKESCVTLDRSLKSL